MATTQNSGVAPKITASPGSVCKVTGDVVTMKTGVGLCTLKAAWAANTYYLAATANQTVTAAPHGTVTTITNTIPQTTHPLKVEVYFTVSNGTTTKATGNVTVTAASGQTCTGSVASGKCLLTFTSPETSNLTATYQGNTDNSTSTSAPYRLTVN